MRIHRTDSGAISLRILALLSAIVLLPWLAWAAGPVWWTTRGVIKTDATADDYAAVNQGQVRHIAKQAYDEMKASLPGGPGTELDALWATPAASTDDYNSVNLGQLKNLAKPFYDRLIALGYATDYPWNTSGKAADDYALANIGQVKNLFAFDPASFFPDTDKNGLIDGWETEYFGHTGVDPGGDFDLDGLTNLEEYQSKTNPISIDTDGDGIDDGYEVHNEGLNPNDTNDANGDIDHDGRTNIQEYYYGTNPCDPNSTYEESTAVFLAQRASGNVGFGFAWDRKIYLKETTELDLDGNKAKQVLVWNRGTKEIDHVSGTAYIYWQNPDGEQDPMVQGTWGVPCRFDKSEITGTSYRSIYYIDSEWWQQVFPREPMPFTKMTETITYEEEIQFNEIQNMLPPLTYTGESTPCREFTVSSSRGANSYDISKCRYEIKPRVDYAGPIYWLELHNELFTGNELSIAINKWDANLGGAPSGGSEIIPGLNEACHLSLLDISLTADIDRDGIIFTPTMNSFDVSSHDKPYRFWINDDNDSGDTGGDDIPLEVGASGRNCDDDHVNGTRDLIDFFPVYLDLKQLLNALPATTPGVKYKLKQADCAVNFIYTNKTRTQAFDYQKQILADGFGPDFTQAASVATTQQVTADGVELSAAFLNLIQNNDGGVILVEGSKATTKPLVLSIEKDNSVLAEVKLELSISSVEDMFRHVDLTGIPKEYDGSALSLPKIPKTYPAPANEPVNYPDSLTNGKYFVFVHGYNVDADKARGWKAEVFKRMYVLGSKARFVGVNWHGATGLDYHQAVFNAFQTGNALAGALSFTGNADVTVAAHSLGNMMVSHAIQSGGFTPSRYYMIDAAVPIEAYSLGDVAPNQPGEMTELAWRPYDTRLYSANWYALFDGSDNRSKLTWKNRFKDVLPKAYNFYSTGEDVVSNATSATTASIVATLLRQGFDVSTGAWKAQELVKGVTWTTSLAAAFMERGQAGWDYSGAWYILYTPPGPNTIPVLHVREPAQTTSITNEELKTMPFFDHFLEGDLVNTDASIASAKAGIAKVQYDLLARGIPAMSNAAAANKLPSLGEDHNFNMQQLGVANGLLPTGPTGAWRHSDVKVVALLYTYPMYERMISWGNLK